MTDLSPAGRRTAAFIALLAWGAVGAQLALNFGAAAAEGIAAWRVPLRLYGYFTIWTNTLVALVAVHAARGGRPDDLLGRATTRATALVSIIVVGLIFNTLLAGLRQLEGVPLLVDALLHKAVPLAYPLWWLTFAARGQLGWGSLLPGMAFPSVYCLVAMARGLFTGTYAYFFLDIAKLGLGRTLLNIAGLVALFAALMAAAIMFDRRRTPNGTAAPH